MSRCSICQTLIAASEAVVTCPECQLEYHEPCWEGLGGCASYGCEKAVEAVKPDPPKQVALGWGDEKTCPACRREIKAGLLRCFCGARFPYPEPMSGKEYREWLSQKQSLSGIRRAIVAMFVLSMTGFLAPLLGLISGILAYSNRKRLAGADGTYLAMGVGTFVLGAIYSLVMLGLWMGW